ncbi:MAG TPA: LLM class F420-dependent oxidoreductase [Acidimicrobiales bacterium]|nr:LLM class F420-dependent oxidoreductase [Acidimicrobiales bacterium]
MTRLGYQIPNFNYPGIGPDGLFDAVAAQAKAADASGFDTVFLMDHFFQLPMLGPPDNYMLECYTTLGALARETKTVRLSALVTGNTYRNPAILAKIVTALDIVSNGRAMLGIGAGWFELEHNSFGIEFGSFSDRFEKLEEALNIILPMLRGERPSLDGQRYRVKDAINEPPPVSRIPVMIGGSGEKKTLRMVAQYADESNLTSPADQLPRKLDVLAEHCARLGRDRTEITLSQHLNVLIAANLDDAYKQVVEFLRSRGLDIESMDEDSRNAFLNVVVWGDEDQVGEKLASVVALGAQGITCSLPGNGHDPAAVEQLGKTASKVLGR